MKFTYGQDYSNVDGIDLSPYNLEKGDKKYIKSDNKEVFDFVGFILDEGNLLSVFPKHYYSDLELKDLNRDRKANSEDIKLLFDVFMKYTKEVSTTARATKYIGAKPEFESDYPFTSFFEIYKYFRQYGIYRESNTEVKPNTNGSVAWKKTIQKAQMIVSNGNLIFSPLYRVKKRQQNVFLSECMVFVIDHTINSFPYFIRLPKTGYKISSFDFIKHREYTLQQLRQISSKTFKDTQKKLITHLIDFFEQYKTSPKGGDVHIKINYFDKIWERMVSNYLNRYFKCVDEVSDSIIFDKSLVSSSLKFESIELPIDDSPHQFKIRLDHHAKQDDSIYIFDSKYYYTVSDLNYKQFSYNELLRGNVSKSTEIFSALILPNNFTYSNRHFLFSPAYLGDRTTGTKILEQYLCIKEVMQAYLSN
ncbi:TPA: LlaJI family restriction endonuclease [Listeria monocytogenes]|nr:LlaJI family restriction endonuclease [Listeria monocytogenes]HDI3440520.1 LlaJI family restriction endonuclease [Listeria monocytogenes]